MVGAPMNCFRMPILALLLTISVTEGALAQCPENSRYRVEELYGRRGEPGVFQLNGTTLVVRVLFAIEQGQFVKYLAIADVTNPISVDTYHLSFDPKMKESFTLGKTEYQIELAPKGYDVTVTLKSKKPATTNTASLRDIFFFYLNRAIACGNQKEVGSVSYYLTPQFCEHPEPRGQCRHGAMLFWRKTEVERDVRDSKSGFIFRFPEYMVQLGFDRVPIGSSGFEIWRGSDGNYDIRKIPD